MNVLTDISWNNVIVTNLVAWRLINPSCAPPMNPWSPGF